MNLKYFAAAAGILALAACDNGANSASLKGKNFVADSNGTPIILVFDANEMRVNGQIVNLYNGVYEIHGKNIKFGPMATTMMMGPAAAMDAERDYFQFLDTVETYDFNKNRLTLKGADGREIVFQQVESLEETEPTPAGRPVMTVEQAQAMNQQ